MKDSVRCPSCNLVQFKSEKCRRCKKTLVFQAMKDVQGEFPKAVDSPADRKYFSELIGRNAKRIRLKKSIGQDRLAALMVVPRQYLTKVEHGRLEPTFEKLYRLADALEVPVTELFCSERELMSQDLLSDPLLAEAAKLDEAQQVAVLEFAKKLDGGRR